MSHRRKQRHTPRLVFVDEQWSWPEDNSPMLGGQAPDISGREPMLGGDRRVAAGGAHRRLTMEEFETARAWLERYQCHCDVWLSIDA